MPAAVKVAGMRTALITGASRGIGAAIADALAPTHTLLLAGRPSPALKSTAERLGATTLPLDLSDTDAIPGATGSIGELDVLIHNAGVSFPGQVGESTVDDWRSTFEVNVIGAVALTLALLPALRRAHGQVVFINSGSGRKASTGMASYSASKFALRAFADSLRQSEPSLRVTTVYPGRTDTDMQRELVSFEGGDYDADQFLRPETVAEVVAHALATPPDGHVHEVVLRPRG
jgi:NADP-dependent 3-hydroxy acid dehydrogenase YdfG